ncbi:MAG TPA: tRNA lysidine(34) synthetase TilS [Planctomycetota bacterium]|nr:tRNA lysidine(34) synthetase TilS [Planctomycetota bacterium]
MSWLSKFERSVDDGRLLEGASKVLVAVSGGADSTALLRLLLELRELRRGEPFPEVVVGHVHHGLRGAGADLDEDFVEGLAREHGLPFFVVRVDVRGEARRRGLSLETAGRAARYDAFRRWAMDLGLDVVLLAHHLDDQAETVLLRAARGVGVRGLAAIPRARPLFRGGPASPATRVIRPLLSWRREWLIRYLAEKGQPFRQDASNGDLTIPRNLVRHRVLGLLEEGVHPGAVRSLARLASTAGRLTADLRSLGARALDEAEAEAGRLEDGIALRVDRLRVWPPTVLHEVLRLGLEKAAGIAGRSGQGAPSAAIRRAALDEVLRWLRDDGPTESRLELGRLEPGGAPCVLELRYGWIRLRVARPVEKTPPPAATIDIPEAVAAWGDWVISVLEPGAKGDPRTSAGGGPPSPPEAGEGLVERLDRDELASSGPLQLRARREGDRFWPLGAPGEVKLKEFLRARRVWPADRGGVPLLVAGERIAWVVGHRIDHRFRVRDGTRSEILLRAVKRC